MGRANARLPYVALLRGINVGGKNKLPMADLVAIFEDAGCRDVESYIQSGNVVFRATASLGKRIAPLVSGVIAERFGHQVPVMTRSGPELRQVVSRNPFLRRDAEPRALHVAFLAEKPTPAQVAALDPNRSPPDELSVLGREIYLLLPNGVARSKLSNKYLDSKLGTTSTLRNWKTVLRLSEMV